MKVYIALFSSCRYESAAAPFSVHYTNEGAERAIEEDKQKRAEEHERMIAYASSEEKTIFRRSPFSREEVYVIEEFEVKE